MSDAAITRLEARVPRKPLWYDEAIALTVGAVGSGAIIATAPSGASGSVTVEVVDATAVASVHVVDEPRLPPTVELPSLDPRPIYTFVAVDAQGREIDDPLCAWTIDPPNEAVEVLGRNAFVYDENAYGTGQILVRCDVGAFSAEIVL